MAGAGTVIFPGVYGRFGSFKHSSFPKGWSYELGYDKGRNFHIKHELMLFNHRSMSAAQFQLRGRGNIGARRFQESADTAAMRFALMADRDHQYELKHLANKAQFLPLHRKILMWDNKIVEDRIHRGVTSAAQPWPSKPPGWRTPNADGADETFFWDVDAADAPPDFTTEGVVTAQ